MNIVPDFAQRKRRKAIFGFPVHDFTWSHALAYAAEQAHKASGQTKVAFLNANNANIMLEDDGYRAVLEEHTVLPDGVGVDIASKILNGEKFQANLNGTDFVPALLTYIERRRRIGLIGGTPEVLAGAIDRFRQHAPWHEFVAVSDGYFDKADSRSVIERLAEARVDILLVGMGTPLQEKWVHDNIAPEHARLVLCVGALFDFVSEIVPRAPSWMRQMRLEWMYRIACEPGRLWRRYILGGPVFLGRVVLYRFGFLKKKPMTRVANDERRQDGNADGGIPSEIVFPLKSASRRQS